MARLARPLILLAALLVINFALPRLLPGDPVAYLESGGQDPAVAISPTVRGQLLHYYGLDQPLPVQFGHYLLAMAQGDLGFSIHFNQPVRTLVLHRVGWTLFLAGGALIVAACGGALLGLLIAWHVSARWSGALGLVALLGGSLPEFAVGLVFLVIFAVVWPLFPTSGALSPFLECGGAGAIGCTGDALRHAFLPGVTLTLAHMPAFVLLARSAAMQEARQPYVTVARAKGLSERGIALRHVVRNAAAPVLAYFGVRVGLLLGGVVIVETLFGYPGLGQLTFVAVESRDYPLLEALFCLYGVAIIIAGTLGDFVLAQIDPCPLQRI